MKPKDIVVGQKYRNSFHKGVLYLGVGQSDPKGGFSDFINKGMAIISGSMTGYLYQPNCNRWNAFYPVD